MYYYLLTINTLYSTKYLEAKWIRTGYHNEWLNIFYEHLITSANVSLNITWEHVPEGTGCVCVPLPSSRHETQENALISLREAIQNTAVYCKLVSTRKHVFSRTWCVRNYKSILWQVKQISVGKRRTRTAKNCEEVKEKKKLAYLKRGESYYS